MTRHIPHIEMNVSKLITGTNREQSEGFIYKKVTFAGVTLCDLRLAIYGPSIENYYANKYLSEMDVQFRLLLHENF